MHTNLFLLISRLIIYAICYSPYSAFLFICLLDFKILRAYFGINFSIHQIFIENFLALSSTAKIVQTLYCEFSFLIIRAHLIDLRFLFVID